MEKILCVAVEVHDESIILVSVVDCLIADVRIICLGLFANISHPGRPYAVILFVWHDVTLFNCALHTLLHCLLNHTLLLHVEHGFGDAQLCVVHEDTRNLIVDCAVIS